MAKKKKSAAPAEGRDARNGSASPTPATNSTTPPASQASSTAPKKSTKPKIAVQPQHNCLIICRNKHWRYISSFHGPWLQLPPEILETLAHMNYNHPRPRPIDPAAFFDLVKIRRLVDEATNIAVRAASGVVSNSPSSQNPSASAFGFGMDSSGRGVKLSPERRHRLRVDATQRLAKAYRLDEIACSVATMQSASTLEDVASLVLQRNSKDPDAKYVHFFHEKIPSRQLAESTSLDPLDEVIADRPHEPEALRTRATIKLFKEDFEGAALDLTEALRITRFQRTAGPGHSQELELVPKGNRRATEVKLDEEQQPSTLELQLLFQRAGVYLNIACQHVSAGLPETPKDAEGLKTGAKPAQTGIGSSKVHDGDGVANGTAPVGDSQESLHSAVNGLKVNGGGAEPSTTSVAPELTPAEKLALRRQQEGRKLVRANAKRALRDYMSYLSHFDYSPDLRIDIIEDFTRKVNNIAHGGMRYTRPGAEVPHSTAQVYPLNDLFTSTPPQNLPVYPPVGPANDHFAPQTTESLTYHPLLTDALHAVLLTHALLQTSSKELLRHAYMAARLARLADGFPVFQASRSPARADWIEVLRRAGGTEWLQLASSWESLCAPAPLPIAPPSAPAITAGPERKALPAPPSASVAQEGKDATSSTSAGTSSALATQAAPATRSAPALEARQQRAVKAYELEKQVEFFDAQVGASLDGIASASSKDRAGSSAGSSSNALTTNGANAGADRRAKRWAVDDGREYPLLTERAAAVARWVREAPAVSSGSGGARRKKKVRKPTAPGPAGGDGNEPAPSGQIEGGREDVGDVDD